MRNKHVIHLNGLIIYFSIIIFSCNVDETPPEIASGIKGWFTIKENNIGVNISWYHAEDEDLEKYIIYMAISGLAPQEIGETEENKFIGLSEIYYPNWEIINHDIDIIQINGLLRGFVVPKGKNKIIMQFNYNDVKYSSFISITIFFVMLLCCLLTYLLTVNNKKIK